MFPPRAASCVTPQEENRDALDYYGFVDFATAVHEHVIGLRSWHPQATRRRLSSPCETTPPPPAALRGHGKVSSSASDGSRDSCAEGGLDYSPRVQLEREEKHIDGGRSCGGGAKGGRGGGAGGRGGGAEEGWGGGGRGEGGVGGGGCAARPNAQGRISPHLGHRRLDPAVPWLGWDVSRNCSDIVDSASGSEDAGCGGPREDKKGGNETEEEPEMNRTYGTTVEERAASVNKVIAFQTDRVVRMLDRMF